MNILHRAVLYYGCESKLKQVAEGFSSPFHLGCSTANVMRRDSPSLTEIGWGCPCVSAQIFLGTTATIPQKQDPTLASQSPRPRSAQSNGAAEMLESEAVQPMRASLWGCSWLREGVGCVHCSEKGEELGRVEFIQEERMT